MSEWGVGEVGGVFAGAVASFAAIGKGLAWLLDWQGERTDRKAERLRLWETSLDRREQEYREGIERELDHLRAAHEQNANEISQLRRRVTALGGAFVILGSEVRALDPASQALVRAKQIVRDAFQPETELPADLADLVAKL